MSEIAISQIVWRKIHEAINGKVSESNAKGEPQFTISRKADLVIQVVGTAPEPVVVKIDPNTGVIQFDRPRP
jgi:hypothetical protein